MVQLVSILNITPDSFSDGGKYNKVDAAIAQARKLANDGASIIDIGAQSTNPKSSLLSVDEEWRRLEPVLVALKNEQFRISIDTFYPEIIARSQRLIPSLIINDVTMAHNPKMRELIAASGLRTIISHLPEEANGNIQKAHQIASPIDDIKLVKTQLLLRRQELIQLGTKPEKIILDPGIGFGKTMRLNNQLIEFAREVPDIPVMIGYSRKRFIEQFLHKDRFDPVVNARLGKRAAESGAQYLRVHDITRKSRASMQS